MIITVPLRDEPDSFPPFAPLALMSYARKHGFGDMEFYHIDRHRPTLSDAVEHIVEASPEVLAISAVVSTSYAFVKGISIEVKKRLPNTLVVLGGNMGASAEIILRQTGVDLVAIGEGERIFVNVLKRSEETKNSTDFIDINGLALLGKNDEFIMTPGELSLPANELYDVDWQDLAKANCLENYIFDAYDETGPISWFRHDPRAYEAHRFGKKVGHLFASKGCVARCTFCHRWDKGIRFIPIDLFMKRLEVMIQTYDVGFLAMADENFGSSRDWVMEFCKRVKPMDIIWHVSGMRASTVTPELISAMKDAGCSSITFGIESGSERMLKIMEKKISLKQNLDAIKWTIDAKLGTSLQLIVGMPGESNETIHETRAMAEFMTLIDRGRNPNRISINYAQALPGTPLYEFGRHRGLIGQELEKEEEYLLLISDSNAADEFLALNFTDSPTLEWLTWRAIIRLSTINAFVQQFGLEQYQRVVYNDLTWVKQRWKSIGYYSEPGEATQGTPEAFSFPDPNSEISINELGLPSSIRLFLSGKFDLLAMRYPKLAYSMIHFVPIAILVRAAKRKGIGFTLSLIWEYLHFKILPKANDPSIGTQSLRKLVVDGFGQLAGDNPDTEFLRRGR